MSDDLDKTIPPRRVPSAPKPAVFSEDVTLPGRRERKPEGRYAVGDLILHRYKVLSELGQGGMGVVYKCFDETAGIEVALKALPPELSHNTYEMEDVKDNFQLVSRLIHQNIAVSKTLERNSVTGDYYLIMECVNGEDLRRWMKRMRRENKISLDTVLPIIKQVADALDYAHREKVIHRDIKPGNIMIDSEGRVKVLDFGLAAQIHTSMTRVSMAYHGTSGTGPYMAPEQWEGRAQNAAADQYALAVMTYEMLAGHLPFESPDAAVLREAVLKSAAESPSGLPLKNWNAISRAMSKDAKARFASCADFAIALGGGMVLEKGGAEKIVLSGSYISALKSFASLHAEDCDSAFDSFYASLCESKMTLESARTIYMEVKRFIKVYTALCNEVESKTTDSLPMVTKFKIIEQIQTMEPEFPPDIAEVWIDEIFAAVLARRQAESAVRDAERIAEEKRNAFLDATRNFESKNYKGAYDFLLKSDLDDPAVMTMLGVLYMDGLGMPKDYAEAMKYFLTAAEKGNAEAEWRLGEMYLDGKGVESDIFEAEKWYLKAAEKGYSPAGYSLGYIYTSGRGVEPDYVKAAHWFKESAEKGYAESQYVLGTMYEEGCGVKCKPDTAMKYFRLAAAQLHPEARKKVAEEDARLLAEERRKRIEAWKKKYLKPLIAGALIVLAIIISISICNHIKKERMIMREKALAVTSSVEYNRSCAEELMPSIFAPEKMKNAILAQERAKSLFDKGKYAESFELFTETNNSFIDITKQIRPLYIKKMLDSALKAKWNKEWEKMREYAEKALALDSGNSEAQALKAEAESSLKPSISISATVDGNPVPATVRFNGKSWTLPVRLDLEENGKYVGTVTYEKGDSEYTDVVSFTADWLGRQERTVKLTKAEFPERLMLPGDVKLEMVRIKAGTFMMGSPATEDGRDNDETQHRVTLTKAYWLGKFEVTQAQYEAVMGSNPSRFKGANLPVENVSWNDAMVFCKKLNERYAGKLPRGYEFTLPTEAQWEYACRAGSTTSYSFGDSDDSLYRFGNYCDSSNTDGYSWQDKAHNDGYDKTAPVGSYSPNSWGLYDMHGNVWEWCRDWYDSYGGDATDPLGAATGSDRVSRGGSWNYYARSCRSANRGSSGQSYSHYALGFRLALAAVQ